MQEKNNNIDEKIEEFIERGGSIKLYAPRVRKSFYKETKTQKDAVRANFLPPMTQEQKIFYRKLKSMKFTREEALGYVFDTTAN